MPEGQEHAEEFLEAVAASGVECCYMLQSTTDECCPHNRNMPFLQALGEAGHVVGIVQNCSHSAIMDILSMKLTVPAGTGISEPWQQLLGREGG
eukprot:6458921-Amphidinium_carterae.1